MTNRFSSRRLLAAISLWVLAGVLLSASWSRAEDPLAPRRRMENRFLFVIDTSSAMKSRRKGVEDAVRALLESGMEGELRKGDTIGLWTFSDRLNTDFPMEVWSEEKKDGIVKEVVEHVLSLQYEKRSHLEKVLPEIKQVVDSSERLTIILIFDGSDLVKLTPFDKDINKLHKQYAAEFRSAHEPFVTILAAHFGAVFDYTINYPSTMMVPHTADPLPPPETNAPPSLAASAPPDEPAPPQHNVQIVLSGADFPRYSPPPAPTNAAPVVTQAPGPASAMVTNAPPPGETAPVTAQTATTNVAPPPVAASPPPPAPAVTTPARTAPPAPSPSTPPTEAAAVSPVVPAPVVQEVAVVPAGQQVAMVVIAFSLLTIAVVLVLLLVRRSRGGPQPSLISQSIDRSR